MHAVVCGLGPSLQEFVPVAHRYFTVGVNDICRHFTPDHLVLLDWAEGFKGDRKRVIQESRPREMIWHFRPESKEPGSQHETFGWPEEVKRTRIKLKICSRRESMEDFLDGEAIVHYQTSPFAAATIAYKLGAKKIGLIGVDLIKPHGLHGSASVISMELGKFRVALATKGVELVNLSPISKVMGLPFAELSEFEERPRRACARP